MLFDILFTALLLNAPQLQLLEEDGPLLNETKADKLFQAEEFSAAAQIYEEALRRRPQEPLLHYKRALSALLLNDPKTAKRYALEALRLDPGNSKALELAALADQRHPPGPPPGLADVRQVLREGRAQTAVQMAETALRSAQDKQLRAQLLRLQGQAQLKLGEGIEAQRLFKVSLGLGLKDSGIWVDLFDAARLRQDPERARYYRKLALRTLSPGEALRARLKQD